MKRTITALLLATAVQPVFAADTELCNALAQISESTYMARLERYPETDLLHKIIQGAEQGDLEFVQITAKTIEIVYDLPYNKIYQGGEAELGLAVFENCIGEGI